MSDPQTLSGGCICGAVRFTAVPKEHGYGVCHCSTCRQWSGGPLFAIDCGDTVRVEDASALASYRSSEWAERQFCKTCGTNLFYKIVDQDHWIVSSEAFDESDTFKLTSEIFIDDKPDHYAFANDTKKMTGAEVFAAFAAGGEG